LEKKTVYAEIKSHTQRFQRLIKVYFKLGSEEKTYRAKIGIELSTSKNEVPEKKKKKELRKWFQ
jgi:hypothetical protein